MSLSEHSWIRGERSSAPPPGYPFAEPGPSTERDAGTSLPLGADLALERRGARLADRACTRCAEAPSRILRGASDPVLARIRDAVVSFDLHMRHPDDDEAVVATVHAVPSLDVR